MLFSFFFLPAALGKIGRSDISWLGKMCRDLEGELKKQFRALTPQNA
jgi:hypothetical protein